MLLGGMLAIIFVLGSVTEKRKAIWRRLFGYLLRAPVHAPSRSGLVRSAAERASGAAT
jgi:hypothetical protein